MNRIDQIARDAASKLYVLALGIGNQSEHQDYQAIDAFAAVVQAAITTALAPRPYGDEPPREGDYVVDVKRQLFGVVTIVATHYCEILDVKGDLIAGRECDPATLLLLYRPDG